MSEACQLFKIWGQILRLFFFFFLFFLLQPSITLSHKASANGILLLSFFFSL